MIYKNSMMSNSSVLSSTPSSLFLYAVAILFSVYKHIPSHSLYEVLPWKSKFCHGKQVLLWKSKFCGGKVRFAVADMGHRMNVRWPSKRCAPEGKLFTIA